MRGRTCRIQSMRMKRNAKMYSFSGVPLNVIELSIVCVSCGIVQPHTHWFQVSRRKLKSSLVWLHS
uniref:Uncharacterized protein n=1 Tax=Anguilla anguilla TaxID=7936 RepID=A0A0E9W5Z1_ANGAN